MSKCFEEQITKLEALLRSNSEECLHTNNYADTSLETRKRIHDDLSGYHWQIVEMIVEQNRRHEALKIALKECDEAIERLCDLEGACKKISAYALRPGKK